MKSPLQSTSLVGNRGIKCAVHGPSGVGKTTLLGTANNSMLFSAEKGLLSLRKQNIPYYDINSLQDVREAWRWLSESKEARQFNTFGWDSVTEVSKIVLREFKAKNKHAPAAYQEMFDEVGLLMRNFRDISGPNVVFIFQTEFYKDDQLGTAVFMPTVEGAAFKQSIPYLVDEVFFMFRGVGADGKPFAALRTQPDFRTVAKDRSGALAEIEAPNLAYIFDKIAKG